MEKEKECRFLISTVPATALRLLIREKIDRYSHLLTQQNLTQATGLQHRSTISRIMCDKVPNPVSLYRIAEGIYKRIAHLPEKKNEALLFLYCCAEWTAQLATDPDSLFDTQILSSASLKELHRILNKNGIKYTEISVESADKKHEV